VSRFSDAVLRPGGPGRWSRHSWCSLDLLLDEGIPVAFSEVEVSTALLEPGEPAGAFLGLNGQTAALKLTETMYLEAGSAEGRPVQWSRNFFLPGKLSLRLVQETPADRDPAIVPQLLVDGTGR
jgi:hypothetical protein